MERIKTADGVVLAAYDFGGDGPDLLLAHATGFHARCWLPVIDALRDRFHCYAFDERAHGDSSPPPDGDFDWNRFGDDALAVVDHFGLDRPYGVGHSCGGALLLLAEMTRPGTFRSLYCFEPVIFPIDEPPPREAASQNPLAVRVRRRREVFDSVEAAASNFGGKPPMSAFAPEALRAYVEHGLEPLPEGGVRLKCRSEHEALVYENGPYHGAYPRLGQVRCPVTLVSGEHTDHFGDDFMRSAAARLPDAFVKVMPGVSHFGPLEQPGALAADIVSSFAADAP